MALLQIWVITLQTNWAPGRTESLAFWGSLTPWMCFEPDQSQLRLSSQFFCWLCNYVVTSIIQKKRQVMSDTEQTVIGKLKRGQKSNTGRCKQSPSHMNALHYLWPVEVFFVVTFQIACSLSQAASNVCVSSVIQLLLLLKIHLYLRNRSLI